MITYGCWDYVRRQHVHCIVQSQVVGCSEDEIHPMLSKNILERQFKKKENLPFYGCSFPVESWTGVT